MHWVKEICDSEPGLNRRVLVTAAYAHDWGYADLFGKSPSLDEIMAMKKKHMIVGAEKIGRLLGSARGMGSRGGTGSMGGGEGMRGKQDMRGTGSTGNIEGGDKKTEVFSESEVGRVVHLVRVHDRLDLVEADDEIVLVEADTLGALDTDFVKPTFSVKDNKRYMQEVMRRRRPLFRHERAMEAFEVLVEKRAEYYVRYVK